MISENLRLGLHARFSLTHPRSAGRFIPILLLQLLKKLFQIPVEIMYAALLKQKKNVSSRQLYFPCFVPECPVVSRTRQARRNHRRNMHKLLKQKQKKNYCSICDIEYATYSAKTHHKALKICKPCDPKSVSLEAEEVVDDVLKLPKDKTSQSQVKNENVEGIPGKETGKSSSAEFDFKKEVVEEIDTHVVAVNKQEVDTTFVEYKATIQSEFKSDDSLEDIFDEQENIQTTSPSTAFQTLATGLEEELQLFHGEVASEVKATLNLYYPEAKEFVGAKMRSREKYKQVARQLSHHMRERIKESHRVLHGGLQGVEMTKEHQVFIRTNVEKFLMDS